MQNHHIDQTQIMEENLHKLIKNQNYFSCFIQGSKQEQQPTNPFQKKLFDKNLRRSTISCGHYNSGNQQNSTLEESHRMASSRRNSLVSANNNDNNRYNFQPILSQQEFYAQLLSQPRMQTGHKVSLAQSRHTDPTKQLITQIINNFRLQLDYLQQKLHHKVDQLNCKYGDRQCNQKDRQAQFMIQSLQKIVGFMVENCVNLEDSVMYGDKSQDQNTGRTSEIIKKEVYQIEEDQNQENMSFSNNNTNIHQFKPTHRFANNHHTNKAHQIKGNLKDMTGKKRKIIGMIEKENINSNNNNNNNNNNHNNNNNEEEQNMPQTYYINSKLHSNADNTKPPRPNQQTTRTINQQSQKPTKRAPSKNSNQKLAQNNNPQTEPYNYHSSKQTIANQSQSNSQNESNYGVKSIYETVLQEREMRLKMRKKIV